MLCFESCTAVIFYFMCWRVIMWIMGITLKHWREIMVVVMYERKEEPSCFYLKIIK